MKLRDSYGDERRDWQSGMSYEDLHILYASPSGNCECDACDRGREWERTRDALLDECPPFEAWQETEWRREAMKIRAVIAAKAVTDAGFAMLNLGLGLR